MSENMKTTKHYPDLSFNEKILINRDLAEMLENEIEKRFPGDNPRHISATMGTVLIHLMGMHLATSVQKSQLKTMIEHSKTFMESIAYFYEQAIEEMEKQQSNS